MSGSGRRLLPPLLVTMATLAYLLPFRGYGLNVEDEGTLLYQIVRVARGELPYADFSTGYTPLFFVLAARLWRATENVVVFRTGVAAVHALTLAALAALIGNVARPLLAIVLPLVYLAFIPVFPGEFCAFNIPYPAWLATLGWTLTAIATVAFVARGGRLWLMAAGSVAAATLGIKPNAGVFAIAAATAVVLSLRGAPARGTIAPATLWGALWIVIVGGTYVALGAPRGIDALVYVVPVVLAMAALVAPARARRARLVGDATALLVPFVVLSTPWLAFFFIRLGAARFVREVLLVGSGAADLYYRPYPPFEHWALLATALVAAFVVAGALVARVPRVLGVVAAAAAVAMLASVAAVAWHGMMPERVLWSLIWQLESAAFPLTLATLAAGIVWLWRRGTRDDACRPAAVLLFAVFMNLQLYPRADFPHLVGAAPLTLVFAGFVLERALRWWEEALRARGWLGARALVSPAVALAFVAAIVIRLTPNLTALAATPRERLPFAVAAVAVEAVHGDELHDLGTAAARLERALASRGAPSPPSLGFPALDAVLLLAGARNPTRHDYYYPGRPDHRDEAEIVDTLAADPPQALAAINRHFTFFDAAPPYYFLLRRFVSERYRLLGRDGRYDTLVAMAAPDDSSRAAPSRAAADTSPAAAATVTALLEDATSDDASARVRALRALLDALARDPAQGLETYVAAAGLDVRRQVLLLRTIRDAREARAATYLFHAAASGEGRLVAEALDAMERTRAELIARRHLWVGAEVPDLWPGRATLLTAVRTTLGDPGAAARAVAFAAELAGTLGDTAAVEVVRARLAPALAPAGAGDGRSSDPAVVASAADALARLAPGGVACAVIPLLMRSDAEVLALLPSTLLHLARGDASARACLTAALETPSPGRAQAVWIAAALADPAFTPALERALDAPEPEVRAAAAWALGELPASPPMDARLARTADEDTDEDVRRFAARAATKRAAAARRALSPPPL